MRKFLLAAITLPALFLFSCQKESNQLREETASGDGIVALLNAKSVEMRNPATSSINDRPRQASFQLLSYAIAKAGLANELNNPKFAYTLFAPTDEAFAAQGLGTRQAINAVPVEDLKAILLYHVYVYGSKVLAAQVPTTYTELTMLSKQKAYIIRRGSDVYINGTPVVAADIMEKSGVIHAIDRLLMPPKGNIVDVAAANPNFSFLVAAVQRAGLVSALSGAGPLTVFAPTNQAFIAAGFPTIAAIEAAPPAALIPILTYHVTGGRTFSSDLMNGQVLTMLSGGTTTVLLTNGPQIDGANSAPSNIIQPDVLATNGVIHTIDRVLLP
ncbi:fasciclin domain-containing protein [Flavisolibacter sp. BT320]|nr:fasciclin domain-containing protein [Flavisolibacter longurius]